MVIPSNPGTKIALQLFPGRPCRKARSHQVQYDQDESRMEKDKKKEYEKPVVKRVSLDAECAVLGFCKTTGSMGPSGSGCGQPFPQCFSNGS
jgi:hypothetical protein